LARAARRSIIRVRGRHTRSGGWAVACVIKSLRRIALARERATLHADPLKCKVLTAQARRPDVDAVLEPLCGDDARHWEVVMRMRVLGVTLSEDRGRQKGRSWIERAPRSSDR